MSTSGQSHLGDGGAAAGESADGGDQGPGNRQGGVPPEDDVKRDTRAPGGGRTNAGRVKQLQAEARQLALGEVQAFERQLMLIVKTATAIATGGDPYPIGIRGVAEPFAEDLRLRVQHLRAIMQRTGQVSGSQGDERRRDEGADTEGPTF